MNTTTTHMTDTEYAVECWEAEAMVREVAAVVAERYPSLIVKDADLWAFNPRTVTDVLRNGAGETFNVSLIIDETWHSSAICAHTSQSVILILGDQQWASRCHVVDSAEQAAEMVGQWIAQDAQDEAGLERALASLR